MRVISLLLVVLFSVLVVPVQAGEPQGIAAYKRGDFATAVRELVPAAEGGSALAQTILGAMAANGEGGVADPAAAAKWFALAAAQGSADAQHNLGYLYETGQGVPKDAATAVKWYRLAAEQGYRDRVGPTGKHHEIYLGDPRRADPSKLKTVLRHPLEKA